MNAHQNYQVISSSRRLSVLMKWIYTCRTIKKKFKAYWDAFVLNLNDTGEFKASLFSPTLTSARPRIFVTKLKKWIALFKNLKLFCNMHYFTSVNFLNEIMMHLVWDWKYNKKGREYNKRKELDLFQPLFLSPFLDWDIRLFNIHSWQFIWGSIHS